jgi:DNA-binding SARP family transcriptional activator
VLAVRVYVTGRICIEYCGRLVDEPQFPGRQGRLLFAYAVCHRNRPLTRAELADAIWQQGLPQAWESALSALVSKLRGVLKEASAPDAELTMAGAMGGYLLRASHGTLIDRDLAAEAVDQAEAFLRAGDHRAAWAPANIAAITARQPFLGGRG